MTGTLETVDDRQALRFERHLEYPVERAWRAVTEPAELVRWFVTAVDWTPRLGEGFEAAGQTGEITELEEPRVIAWTWGGDRFGFELRRDGEGCVLVFTHVFADQALAAQHAAGWAVYLSRLDAHLAGRFVSETDAHEPVAALHEQYAQRFGLDPDDGRHAIAAHQIQRVTVQPGSTLRFERRFGHAVERVWRAVTDPEEMRHWFPPGDELQVTRSEPPRLLTGTWFGDELCFELRPDGDACVLVFTHTLADGETAARDAAGWDRCFVRLDALLAGEPMSEADSLRGWPEVHERYAADFGVDPEVGRRAFAQHPSQQ